MSGSWSENGQRSCVQSHSGEGKLCEESKIAGKNPNSWEKTQTALIQSLSMKPGMCKGFLLCCAQQALT